MSPTSSIPLTFPVDGLDSLTQATLHTGLAAALQTLQSWAQTSAAEDLLASFDQGSATAMAAVRSLHQAWQQGDFSQLPRLTVRSAADLSGALGAFASDTQTIYLARPLLAQSPTALTRVLLEEIGHFVDAQVNATDTLGDEGALFAAQVQSLHLSETWLAALQTEQDALTLHLDGQSVAAEAMTPYTGNNLDQFQDGLEDFLSTLEGIVGQLVAGQELPLIGSALQTVSEGAEELVAAMRAAIATQLAALPELTPAALEQALNQALGADGLGILETLNVLEAADEVQFDLTLSRELLSLGGADLGLALGETGLSLDIEGNPQLNANLALHLLLGLNATDGFYVDTALEDEFGISLSAEVPDLAATATLGFLQMEATDNGSQLTTEIGLDLQDSDDADTRLAIAEIGNLSNTVEANLQGNATFDVNLSSGTTVSMLPSIGTNLLLNWDFLDANLDDGVQTEAPTVAFNAVSLDVGSFFGSFVGPIFGGITEVLDPIMPLVEKLNEKLPILDATMIDVAQALAENGIGNFNPETAEFVRYVAEIAEIITLLGNLEVDGETITLGDFSVLAGEVEALQTEVDVLGQLAGLSDGTSSFVDRLSERLRFPILSQPESVIQLLLGQSGVDIFQLDLPLIGFGVDYETRIPIFGPINVTLGGALGAAANLSFGFGIPPGGFDAPGAIAEAFYVSTPADPGTPPRPIAADEIFTVGLGAGVFAGVDINLGVISGGVEAGLIAQLFLNLSQDRTPLADFAVPACLFEALGTLDAEVAAKLTIGFGPFSIRKRIEIVRETLLDFRAACSATPQDNQQATVGDGGTAVLSVGEDAANLVDIETLHEDGDEVFTVTHVPVMAGEVDTSVAGDETITVAAYGTEWTYENVSRIEAAAGDGNDIIELVAVRSDSHLKGEAGDDELYGGWGVDILEGGAGDDYLFGGAGDDELAGGDGNDFLEGGAGNDHLDGGDGIDSVSYASATDGVVIDLPNNTVLDGDGTQDTIENVEQFELSNQDDTFVGNNSGNVVDGLAGDDVITGGSGQDFLIGGAGADTIDGGGGSDGTSYLENKAGVHLNLAAGMVYSGNGSDADGDILISIENVLLTMLDDEARGDDADNHLVGAAGNDVIEGKDGADKLDGGTGIDTVEYRDSPTGVTVSLQTDDEEATYTVGQGGHAAGDRLYLVLDDQGNPTGRNTFENLTGSDQASAQDRLTGDRGDNTIRGLAGDDELAGADGNDTLFGGFGADQLDGGNGLDWADYSDYDLAVTVNLATGQGAGGHAEGDEYINIENVRTGNAGDTIQGNGLNNDLEPGLSTSGTGIDIVDGGGETDERGDRLRLDYSSVGSSLQGGYDYDTGSTDSGEFIGNAQFNDIEQLHIVAGYLGDRLQGGAGDDFINGGAGNDTIFGGQGSNFILGDDGDDTITNLNNAFGEVFYTPDFDETPIYWVSGGAGIDTFSGNFARETQNIILTSLDPDTENPDQFFAPGNGSVIHQFERFQNIQTGRGDDELTQLGRVDNDFRTGAGDDVVHPGLGLDSADGGIDGFSSGEHPIPGDDLLIVDYSVGDIGGGLQSQGDNNLFEMGRYYRMAADGVTLLDEIEFVNFERAHVDGTQHADAIVGLTGADELRGHDGNDRLNGRNGHDQIWGGAGDDALFGGNGDDTLHGDGGNDIVIGGAGNDTMHGGSGNDILIGINFGTNPFPAEAEIDTMTGGRGADWFWLGDGLFPYYDDGNAFSGGRQNQAIVTDFSQAQGDVVFLHGAASDYTLQTDRGSTRILRNGLRPELIGTLEGVTGLSLNSAAFQFVDDAAEDEALGLLLPAVQNGQGEGTVEPSLGLLLPAIQKAAGQTAPQGQIEGWQAPGATPAALLLPAVQAAREAARSPQPQSLPTNFGVLPDQDAAQLPPSDEAKGSSAAIAPPNPTAVPVADTAGTFSITPQTSPYVLLNTFLGDTTGLTIQEAHITGDTRAFGTFQYDPFGLGNGIVLSTGKVVDLVGENQVDGGFVGNASIPLDFVKLGDGGGWGFDGNFTLNNGTAGIAIGNAADDFVANPENPDPPETPSTGIFRANLSDLNQIRSLKITDSGLGSGGAGGDRSGFDLVGLKLSNVLIDDATSIDDIPGIDLFDFSPVNTFFTPGTQRPSENANFPVSRDLAGSLHGQVNNAIATLSEFDFEGDRGFVSLGDGGEVGFNLTETLDPEDDLYLYVGEAANNGESLAGRITASAQRINGQDELSTDFGAPGAAGDTTRLSFNFEADGSTEQVFFRFVFASEEFVEFGGSDFNDAFSLKLNGFNLARLSDGSAATINNLVINPFGNYHPDFVHNPVGDGPASSATPLDGYTQVLTFAGPVNPNAVNHLEIEVKDVADGWQDTAVFLQAGSFGTSTIPKGGISFSPRDSTLLEGHSSVVNLKLNTVPTDTVTVTLDPNDQLDLGQGAGVPLEVFFSPEEALTNRQIAFTADDDKVVEGIHSGLITATVHSLDPSYGEIDSLVVEQLIIDNDTAPAKGRDTLLGRGRQTPLVGLPTIPQAPATDPSAGFKTQPLAAVPVSLSLGMAEAPLAIAPASFAEMNFATTAARSLQDLSTFNILNDADRNDVLI